MSEDLCMSCMKACVITRLIDGEKFTSAYCGFYHSPYCFGNVVECSNYVKKIIIEISGKKASEAEKNMKGE